MLWGLREWQTLLRARPRVVSLASMLLWPTVILSSLIAATVYFAVPLDGRYAVLSFIVFSLCFLLTIQTYTNRRFRKVVARETTQVKGKSKIEFAGQFNGAAFAAAPFETKPSIKTELFKSVRSPEFGKKKHAWVCLACSLPMLAGEDT